jgi:hypothetical protein
VPDLDGTSVGGIVAHAVDVADALSVVVAESEKDVLAVRVTDKVGIDVLLCTEEELPVAVRLDEPVATIEALSLLLTVEVFEPIDETLVLAVDVELGETVGLNVRKEVLVVEAVDEVDTLLHAVAESLRVSEPWGVAVVLALNVASEDADKEEVDDADCVPDLDPKAEARGGAVTVELAVAAPLADGDLEAELEAVGEFESEDAEEDEAVGDVVTDTETESEVVLLPVDVAITLAEADNVAPPVDDPLTNDVKDAFALVDTVAVTLAVLDSSKLAVRDSAPLEVPEAVALPHAVVLGVVEKIAVALKVIAALFEYRSDTPPLLDPTELTETSAVFIELTDARALPVASLDNSALLDTAELIDASFVIPPFADTAALKVANLVLTPLIDTGTLPDAAREALLVSTIERLSTAVALPAAIVADTTVETVGALDIELVLLGLSVGVVVGVVENVEVVEAVCEGVGVLDTVADAVVDAVGVAEAESVPVLEPEIEALAPVDNDEVGVADMDGSALLDAVGVSEAVGVSVEEAVGVGVALCEAALVVLGVTESLPVTDALAPTVSEAVGDTDGDALIVRVLQGEGGGVRVMDGVPEPVAVCDRVVDGVKVAVEVCVVESDGEAVHVGVMLVLPPGVSVEVDVEHADGLLVGVDEELSLPVLDEDFVVEPVGVPVSEGVGDRSAEGVPLTELVMEWEPEGEVVGVKLTVDVMLADANCESVVVGVGDGDIEAVVLDVGELEMDGVVVGLAVGVSELEGVPDTVGVGEALAPLVLDGDSEFELVSEALAPVVSDAVGVLDDDVDNVSVVVVVPDGVSVPDPVPEGVRDAVDVCVGETVDVTDATGVTDALSPAVIEAVID